MELDTDKIIEHAIRDGVREGIKQKMNASYGNPFEKMIGDTIAAQGDSIRALLMEGLTVCIGDESFREEVRVAVRGTLARSLVQRFGGELEKQVNTLKSDPATRARITVAIENIVAGKAT